ncbi:MAG: hypothetical protein DHS20C07_23650 [Methyloligella sp.]|nr:MAG: hypothetical protein DHS20C07_23650 [Methyloligella sp.]
MAAIGIKNNSLLFSKLRFDTVVTVAQQAVNKTNMGTDSPSDLLKKNRSAMKIRNVRIQT